jgi:hypothetical protein
MQLSNYEDVLEFLLANLYVSYHSAMQVGLAYSAMQVGLAYICNATANPNNNFWTPSARSKCLKTKSSSYLSNKVLPGSQLGSASSAMARR